MRVGPGNDSRPAGISDSASADEPRAVIGVIHDAARSTSRDTLGVLVSTVRAGSPAEKAGIEEGNRIASINGVSLKLAAADIGDDEMAGVDVPPAQPRARQAQAGRRGRSSRLCERADEDREGQDDRAGRPLSVTRRAAVATTSARPLASTWP